MSVSNGYNLSDLRRAIIRSWLSTIISLCRRARDITPFFTLRSLPAEPVHEICELHVSEQHISELHTAADVDGRTRQPRVDLPRSSRTQTPPPADDAPLADSPDALSAAIEVKFLLPVLKHGADDNKFPGDPRPILAAPEAWGEEQNSLPAALIRRAHESVASAISQRAGTAVPQRAVALHDIEAARRLERDYWDTHWIVKKANSALPTAADDDDAYLWIPVEVCSPKQRWDERDDDGGGGLRGSLRCIAAVLRALATRHRVTVNYTCDVHVHVGRDDGRRLRLETLKRLATMLWLSEDAIRSVRDPASPNYLNVFTWGAEMTRHSRLARLVGPKTADYQFAARLHHSLSDDVFLGALRQQKPAIRAIWNARTHRTLGRLLSGSTAQYRRLGFNFSSFGEEDERAANGPKTVEFRVLEGTLEEDIISAWVAICWGLVEVAGEGVACDSEGGGRRFAKVVKSCLGDIDPAGYGCDTAARGCGAEQETFVKCSRLRALAVDCLGIGADMYDAFIHALLVRRGI